MNKGKALTAGEITAQLQIRVPVRFPGTRVWRMNSGLGYGIDIKNRVLNAKTLEEAKRAFSTMQPFRAGVPGCADIFGILPNGGRHLWIEVKAAGDKMREQQLNFRDMIREAGGIYLVARGVEETLMDLEKGIKGPK